MGSCCRMSAFLRTELLLSLRFQAGSPSCVRLPILRPQKSEFRRRFLPDAGVPHHIPPAAERACGVSSPWFSSRFPDRFPNAFPAKTARLRPPKNRRDPFADLAVGVRSPFECRTNRIRVERQDPDFELILKSVRTIFFIQHPDIRSTRPVFLDLAAGFFQPGTGAQERKQENAKNENAHHEIPENGFFLLGSIR